MKYTKLKNVPNRLWKYRKEWGLTQKDVAFCLELKSSSQVSKWERGERIPSTRNLLRLSALYHRLANDLLRDLFDLERERVMAREKLLMSKKLSHEKKQKEKADHI